MENSADRKTVRQEVIGLLSSGELTVRDLSQTVGLTEKDIFDHLVHIEKTLPHQGKKLIVSPYKCLTCGYVFVDRTRLTKPGRCPECKKSRIRVARFSIR